MSIYLNVSNSLQPLSLRLAKDLKTNCKGPFVKQWVVTQTEGMNSWLKQTIAKENKIAANINFCNPNDIITEIYRSGLSTGKQTINTEIIRWSIYEILDFDDFKTKFEDIASYYQNNDIKRIALSDELADLYDQYQVYRHETVKTWDDRFIQEATTEDWQEWIWHEIKKKLGDVYQDRVEMAEILIQGLSEDSVREVVKSKMPTLHLFGIAVITPYYLSIFHELAKFMDIHLYLVNPSPEQIWMDDHSEQQISKLLKKQNKQRKEVDHLLVGNDLLLNWGAIIKESFKLIMENDEFVNVYNEEDAEPIVDPKTLLKKIQYDIYHNLNKTTRQPLAPLEYKDGSITINGAFTPVREVEILQNYLIELVDKRNESLSPKDILVLVSDIETYAPYINAVFSNAPKKFPYNIADESYSSGNNLFTAIQEILSIDATTFKAEDVLSLLESPYIRNRFKIKDEETLRIATRQAGIIFGIEGRPEDDTRYISWKYGLKKMIYGICMSGEGDYDDGIDQLIPLDNAEGAEAIERVRLMYFVRMLQQKLADRNQSRTISEWADYLQILVEEMIFEAGEKDDEDYTKLVQFTEQMVLVEKNSDVEISFEVFRHSFLQRLDVEKKAGSFAKGGITFCSLVPMRSIPFKVVALLGMDFDKFPRKETALSFSLLNDWKPGDRNVKNNDKHLFLETLMSAQNYLYISYLAANAKDGASLPASSMVDELIDYVARGIQIDTDALRKAWVTMHPLHSFSSKYNAALPSGLISYLDDNRYKTGIVHEVKHKNDKDFLFNIVNIDDIASFLQNPARLYLKKQFNIFYREEEVLLQAHELFYFDHLTKWNVQDKIMFMDEAETDAYYEKEKKTGRIPLHNMGKASIGEVIDDLEPIRERLNYARGNEPRRTVPINFNIHKTQIIGKLEPVFGNKYISVCNSKQQLKYLIVAYTKYLAMLAQGEAIEFVFISKYIDGLQRIPVGTISQQVAIDTLAKYLDYYIKGHQQYFHFFPAIGQNEMEMVSETHDLFWDTYENSKDGELDFTFEDDYLNKAVEHGFFDESAFEQIKENVNSIFGPIKGLLPEVFAKIKQKK
jgi:exodeoxyribonuclease V gamma subunit